MATAPQILYASRVVLGSGDGLRIAAAAVTIEGSRIAAVEEMDAAAFAKRYPNPDPAQVIDFGDRLLTPAFINAHTHLSMASLRGLTQAAHMAGNVIENLFFRLEVELTAADIRAFTRLGAYESLLAGVGLVWDHYYEADAVIGGIRDVGLAAVVAPTLQDLEGPGKADWEGQLAATEALAGDPQAAAAGVFAAVGPHATDTVSTALWTKAAATAKRLDLPVHAHVAQTFDEYERSSQRHGCSPVQRLSRDGVLAEAPTMLLVHGIFISEGDLPHLDPRRHALGYCPLSQLQFCFPAHVPTWTRAEVPWIVGTDCACSNDGMSVQRELPIVAGTRALATAHSDIYRQFRHTGTLEDARRLEAERVAAFDHGEAFGDPQFLLSRVWSVPGRLHPAFVAGVIEPGALANVVVWDPDHPAMWPASDLLRTLAFADTASAIHGLMVAGRWRGERGRFHRSLTDTDDYRAAVDEATERLDALLGRLRG